MKMEWFEYAAGWMTDMTCSEYSALWRLVRVLREVGKLSGAHVFVNKRRIDGNWYSLVFINWTKSSMDTLSSWWDVHPEDRIDLSRKFDLASIEADIRTAVEAAEKGRTA